MLDRAKNGKIFPFLISKIIREAQNFTRNEACSHAKISGFNAFGKFSGEVSKVAPRKYPRSFSKSQFSTHYTIRIDCPDFTSLCPVTGQPDFAEIVVEYVPNKRCIETKSLKLYLASYRNVHSFNEGVVNRILDDLVSACEPRSMRIEGRSAARGGLALTVTTEHPPADSSNPHFNQKGRDK